LEGGVITLRRERRWAIADLEGTTKNLEKKEKES
jgi:hypothetical protein